MIFGSVRLMIVGPATATGPDKADLLAVFFAAVLVAAFVALAAALFVVRGADFALALVVVFAFILKPFLPSGGWCIDDQEIDTAAHLVRCRNEFANA